MIIRTTHNLAGPHFEGCRQEGLAEVPTEVGKALIAAGVAVEVKNIGDERISGRYRLPSSAPEILA